MDVSPPLAASGAAAQAACRAWFGSARVEFGGPLDGGFAGTPPVRVRPGGGDEWLVLKPFPAGTARDRAEWVHSLLRHLGTAGISEVPQPRETRAGGTIATDPAGVHWELLPLVAGRPVAAPSATQAASALATLARVHVAACTMRDSPPRAGPSPGVLRRITQARQLEALPWRERHAAAARGDCPEAMIARWTRAIEIFASLDGRRALANVAAWPLTDVPLQAVLRDVWSAHVLFAADGISRVAGIVDAHAAGIDTPATDVARLLGSWGDARATPDLVSVWPDALAAYTAVRTATAAELRLVPFLHAAGVVCGLDNWFRWACEERRSFAAAALSRIDRLLAQLPAALAWLARRPDSRV